ncbi:hypothetical protein ACFL5Q_04895, partial [Planctomycetota bacterium]
MRIHRHQKAPRGVVLLLILALMAMFGMVVLAFVMVSRREQADAKTAQRVDEQAVHPENEIKQAALQVFRGSRNPRSRLVRHSLLEDLYGTSVQYGDMAHGDPHSFVDPSSPYLPAPFDSRVEPCPVLTPPSLDGQLIAFTPAHRSHLFDSAGTPPGPTSPAVYEYTSIGNPHLFVGRTLTMLNGVARNQSTRVVGYDAVNGLLHILPFENVSTAAFIRDVRSINPQTSYRRYMINGAPFSGGGFGYGTTPGYTFPELLGKVFLPNPNPFAGSFDLPYALLPNIPGPGAANEGYDAPDYQNMLMAVVFSNGTVPVPSLHRPALINYWYHRLENYLMSPPYSLPQDEAWLAILQPWGADGMERGPPDDPIT